MIPVAHPSHWRPSRRDTRLASGLVLFAYVASHLVNHALGLFSIAVAERGLHVAVSLWQGWPGTILLYGAAGAHVALAFVAVYERRTLRLPPIELLRIVLGFAMPTLLIAHAVGTRLALEIYGQPPDYAHVVWGLWHSGRQGFQIALLVPGWVHGCLGLNLAFRRRAWFARLRLPLFGAALLLPVLAVLGFLSMGKEVAELAATPGFVASTLGEVGAVERVALGQLAERVRLFYFGAIAAVLVARGVRSGIEKRLGNLVTIDYPGRRVRVPRHWSVLEASRSHRIAHVSSCGGRGRCSTCRVRIVEGAEHCPLPSPAERRTLARVGASPDTRLACQLRPEGNIRVVPLLVASRPSPSGPAEGAPTEHELVAMLVSVHWDVRHDRLLPHDRLYAARRFSEAVLTTAAAGGGVATPTDHRQQLLLFGIGETPGEAGRQALRSARAIVRSLERMNGSLHESIGVRARCVIRLQTGLVAIGGDPGGPLRAAGDPIDRLQRAAAADAGMSAPTSDDDDVPSIWASSAMLSTAGLMHALDPGGDTRGVGSDRLLRIAHDRERTAEVD